MTLLNTHIACVIYEYDAASLLCNELLSKWQQQNEWL